MLVTHSLTHSLTHCRLVNLIDVTLACEDAKSKLIKVVTVDHDVDDEVPLQVERRCPPLRSNISEMFCRGPGPPPCLSALTASHYNKYTDTQKNTSIHRQINKQNVKSQY